MISLEDIQKKASELGWDDVGITSATIPEEDIAAYEQWVKKKFHAEMGYMENPIRCNPEQFFPGAKTAILFVSYYKQEKVAFQKNHGIIASYARGRDYHNVHRKRLKKFIHWLEEISGQKEIARGFSDSAPLLEKALAVKAGLGWFGKNTLLIHRKFGTFILLSGLLTSLTFEKTVEQMRLPRCGSCTRCLDACPTQALVSPYELDASKCLSYHLIESKKEIPPSIQEKNPGYLFGCDICQDVCPHNIRKQTSDSKDFSYLSGHGSSLNQTDLDLIYQNPERLHGTPLKRSGAKRLLQIYQQIKSLAS